MDNTQKEVAYKFGLVGKQISYSFSAGYFTEKFQDLDLPHTYVNFDLSYIDELQVVIKGNKNLKGLNVTIPYKESVMPLLDNLNKRAKKIGAVNTIKITSKGKLKGYNTDYYGFKNSIKPFIKPHHKKALILGTGGASKAIVHALKKMNIQCYFVSRTHKKGVTYTYDTLSESIIQACQIIVNCSPVGTHPNIEECPDIPYEAITNKHIVYDLIYNPLKTQFLINAGTKGATIINGLEMLKLQAEKSWEIWNKNK